MDARETLSIIGVCMLRTHIHIKCKTFVNVREQQVYKRGEVRRKYKRKRKRKRQEEESERGEKGRCAVPSASRSK